MVSHLLDKDSGQNPIKRSQNYTLLIWSILSWCSPQDIPALPHSSKKADYLTEVKTFPWFNKFNFKATERKQKISLYSNKKNWAKRCQKTPKKINARYGFIYLSKASREILMSLMFWLQNMVQYVKGQWAAGHQRRLEPPLCPIPAPASTAHQRDRLAFWPLQVQNSKADTSFGI